MRRSVGESVANPLLYYDVNVGGTVRLLQAMQEAGVRNVRGLLRAGRPGGGCGSFHCSYICSSSAGQPRPCSPCSAHELSLCYPLMRSIAPCPIASRAPATHTHTATQLVFSSSACVYGEPDSVPIDESAPLLALNPYGRTKVLGQELRAVHTTADEPKSALPALQAPRTLAPFQAPPATHTVPHPPPSPKLTHTHTSSFPPSCPPA